MTRDKIILDVALDKRYNLNLDDDLNIDRSRINDELAEQPGKFAWYATLYEMARNKSSMLKSGIDAFRAELYKYYKDDAQKSGTKLTEDGTQALINSNDDLNELIDQYNTARMEEGMLFVARSAFEQRKDMLISIASNMRQEWDSELRINKEAVRSKIDAMRGKS